MNKSIRITLGSAMSICGVVFFVLPGSMLVLVAGLLLLSYDIPKARILLRSCQRSMSRSAKRLDAYLLNRKLR